MPWNRDGAAWTHETCPYAVSLIEDHLEDGSPIDSYVVSVDREYFVGAQLENAQQYAEQLWRMRRNETCPYEIRVATEKLANGATRSAFIVKVDGECVLGSTLEQARARFAFVGTHPGTSGTGSGGRPVRLRDALRLRNGLLVPGDPAQDLPPDRVNQGLKDVIEVRRGIGTS